MKYKKGDILCYKSDKNYKIKIIEVCRGSHIYKVYAFNMDCNILVSEITMLHSYIPIQKHKLTNIFL